MTNLTVNAAAMISRAGRAMTLRRSGETDLTVKGVRQDGQVVENGGTAVLQSFRVRIAPTELLASVWATKVPSAETDVLVVESRPCAVLDVEPIHDGDTLAMYELTVAG